ncbi:hypothetical protein GTA08_BOTSDO01883 [Botryosphaeria dothidea]|uniref:Uncharacterized protein n=1 Tax=Botryosphaeria dothidea TaxID=55169 RepID=A0A8H4N7Z8_9PEZI|nr:hypothetical protein GTA08_BOTSDO01883 [Botryosphaeria dothidea]
MVDETIERYTSYGRGGAGNLRRRSELRAAETVLVQSKDDEESSTGRRRSSVWSLSSSPGSRRDSIWKAAANVFRRHSSADDGVLEPKE